MAHTAGRRPRALLGGWLGETLGLRAALGFASSVTLLLVLVLVPVAWRLPLIRNLQHLPEAERESEWLRLEADVRPVP